METLGTVHSLQAVLAVAPVHQGRLLHLPRVDSGGPTHLLGHLDTLLSTLQSGHQLQIKRSHKERLMVKDYLGDELAGFLWLEITGLSGCVHQNCLHLLYTGDGALDHGAAGRGTHPPGLLPALGGGAGVVDSPALH